MRAIGIATYFGGRSSPRMSCNLFLRTGTGRSLSPVFSSAIEPPSSDAYRSLTARPRPRATIARCTVIG